MSAVQPVSARVLIAEDSVVNSGVLIILLETAGYDVISVKNGTQAVDALQNEVFDLAILDHDMPGAGGIATLAEVREFRPELLAIVCADAVAPEDTARYQELGIDHVLGKPVDPLALRDTIVRMLTHRHPQLDARLLATPSFRAVQSTHAAAARSPLAAGHSRFAKKLQTDLLRLRDFRSLAILEGPVGCGRFDIALSLAPAENVHTFVCHADEFNLAHLDRLLRSVATDSKPVFFVLLEADGIDAVHQAFIEELLSGRAKNYEFLARRLRMIFCAQQSLSDLHFNELLLMRAVTTTLRIPDFADRWMDWASISRAILSRIGTGRSTFDPEAIRWIDRHIWTGNFMQLHRVIELARRRAGIASVLTIPHLESAVADEPSCNDPLFHDLLFHVYTDGNR